MKEAYRFIRRADPDYPEKLMRYPNMPSAIYVKGSLPDPRKKTAAIIGSRRCSVYGRQTASYFANKLAKGGVQIISGLALGIDACAHSGAIDAGGKTFGVSGCGINIVYPKSNLRIYQRTLSCGGGIITEFEPNDPPAPYHFPIRNRIISAMSDAVIIIEAGLKSGSLITARCALEQGVQLYAVPGRICDSLSFGTNNLIMDGAFPALRPEHILEDMGIKLKNEEKSKNEESNIDTSLYSEDERKILKLLAYEPASISDICSLTGLDISYVSQLLLLLELNGKIIRPSSGTYIRNFT